MSFVLEYEEVLGVTLSGTSPLTIAKIISVSALVCRHPSRKSSVRELLSHCPQLFSCIARL